VAVSVRKRNLIILSEDENNDDPGEDSSTREHIALLNHVPTSFDANTSVKDIDKMLKEHSKHNSRPYKDCATHAANLRELINMCHVTGEQDRYSCHDNLLIMI
jgi:hypothetical protein